MYLMTSHLYYTIITVSNVLLTKMLIAVLHVCLNYAKCAISLINLAMATGNVLEYSIYSLILPHLINTKWFSGSKFPSLNSICLRKLIQSSSGCLFGIFAVAMASGSIFQISNICEEHTSPIAHVF